VFILFWLVSRFFAGEALNAYLVRSLYSIQNKHFLEGEKKEEWGNKVHSEKSLVEETNAELNSK